MKKIKVMQLITALGTGGAESVVISLATNLDPERFETVVVSLLPDTPRAEALRASGVRVISLHAKRTYDPSILLRCVRLLLQERPDILHTHLFHADVVGAIAGRVVGVRHIISTVHNITFGSAFRVSIRRILRRLFDWQIGVAAIVTAFMAEKKISSVDRMSVIHNAITVDTYHAYSKEAARQLLDIPIERRVMLAMGRLVKQKGYPYLLAAMEQLPSDLHLYILGEGPLRPILQADINRIGRAGSIHLVGAVPDVRPYLAAADLFVMPSLWEGFSVALLEAAAAGLPIVATDVGGNGELITTGVNGLLVEPKRADVLQTNIERLLHNPVEARAIAIRAQQDVEASFSLATMIQAYETIYEQMAAPAAA